MIGKAENVIICDEATPSVLSLIFHWAKGLYLVNIRIQKENTVVKLIVD